jgi:hypothetical protein
LFVISASIQLTAQSAGNAVNATSTGNNTYMNDSYGNGYIPYQQPKGVNLNPSYNSTITPVKADVMINMKATSYVAILSVTQVGETIEETDSMMDIRLNNVFEELLKVGISIANTHVDFISMVPKYDFESTEKKYSKTFNEVPAGFEMKKNIHVLFKKHDLLDKIISEMAYANVYDMVKVEYNIDGAQTYYEELRKAALSVIETKKETYSQLQFHLVSYNVADGFNVSYPMERYKSYTAFHSGASPYMVSMITADLDASLDKAQRTAQLDKLNREFTIQTSEKNKTIFYDRMPYNQFDKVLNSDVAEPCIQFFYILQVGYTIMTDEQYKISEENKVLNKQNQRYAGMTKKQIRRLKKLENGKL